VIGLGLELYDGARDPTELGGLVRRFYEAIGAMPDRMTFRNPLVKTHVFKPAAFEKALRDPSVPSLILWSERDDVPQVHVFLRFVPDPKAPGTEAFEQRWFAVTMPAPAQPVLDGPLLDLLRGVVPLVRTVQGSAALYRSHHAASHECRMGTSPPDVDDATRARIKEDNLSWSTRRRRIRRLYPVTIIGPELWEKLPPLPDVEPRPRIEDLGDCKMLTVWPELCGPREPEFLRGTRALREWLWPHTIQNPADVVDG
jgi:hypothetical protein